MTPEERKLKDSLLLIQNIVYGNYPPIIGYQQYSYPTTALQSLAPPEVTFEPEDYIVSLESGTMTDNAPISVVTWNVNGVNPIDLLSPWKDCLTLFTRM